MNMWAVLAKAITSHGDCALATVIATQGSTPRETDAWMVVTANGFHGSIGGGTVEWRVMAEAQAMLNDGMKRRQLDYVLGPDLGQCCGGRMQIAIEVFSVASLPLIETLTAEERDDNPAIYIFGAGHVGRALVLALAPLPFFVNWIDPRSNAFPSAVPLNVRLFSIERAVDILQDAPSKSYIFVMTHSHALDFEIVDAALRLDILYVGVIGSSTKRARFEKRLANAGVSKSKIDTLICPIGVSGIRSKHPAAIAASVVAQILQLEGAKTHQHQVQQPTALRSP